MSFLVEDGTGLSNANSYGADAGFTAYFADRGVTIGGLLADRQAALVKATDFLDQRYCFKGCRLAPGVQALQWPRVYVYDEEGVLLPAAPLPAALLKATYELAQRALTADLSPDPTVNAAGVVVKDRVKVGPIETETEFSGSSPSSSWAPVYPEVTALLKRLIIARVGVYRA